MCTWTATDSNNNFGMSRGWATNNDDTLTVNLRDKRDLTAPANTVEVDFEPRYEAILLAGDYLAETVVRGAVPAGDRGVSGDKSYVGEGIDQTHHHTALLWMDIPSGAPVSLHPRRLLGTESDSYVANVQDNYAAGYGRGDATGQRDIALLWSLTEEHRVISLHPGSALGEDATSRAHSVTDRYVIGSCSGETTGGRENAVVWQRGTRLSAVNIHPTNLLGASAASRLHDADGATLVGYGNGTNTGHCDHALAWTEADSEDALFLHPLRLLGKSSFSYALSVTGGRVAGHGRGERTRLYSHALLWTKLTPGAAIDLHPTMLLGAGSCSYATAVMDNGAVGFGRGAETDYMDHALVWDGDDASNAIDLHQFAPAGSQSSRAYGIDTDGNILGWIDGQAAIWKRVR